MQIVRVTAVATTLMALGAAGAETASAQQRPIDRWLLSRPFPTSSSVAEQGPLPTVAELNPLFAPGEALPLPPTQLEEDLARADSLEGRPSNPQLDEALGRRPPQGPPGRSFQEGPLRPGWMARRDSVLFPERGMRVGATIWTLIRQDGNPTFDLDTLVDRSGATATFAHAYVRPSVEQTVKLTFTGLGCTTLSATLNERPVELPPAGECGADDRASSTSVRLAAGWNALLVKAEAEGSPYGFSVSVEPGPDGRSVEDVRIQASRPPGVHPILPEAAIGVMAIRVPSLQLRGDDLAAEVVVDFRLWGGYPPEDAEAKVKIGREKAEHRFGEELARTDVVESVFELVPLEELRRVALGAGVAIELEWKDHDETMVRRVAADAVLRALHEPIGLRGWSGGGAGLPQEGSTLSGRWKIPGWLSGFSLELLAEESPGTYSVAGQALEFVNGGAVLCTDCEKGLELRLDATATADWSALPRVRITGPAYVDAATADGAPPPEGWLRAISEDGSESYRELLARYAGESGGR